MAKYRQDLPQRHGGTFLTDGGQLTTLIFQESIDLPYLASFVLLYIAQRRSVGSVLSSPTWRANPDWAEKLGYNAAALDGINKDSMAFLEDVPFGREMRGIAYALCHQPAIGPRGRRLRGGAHGCR